MLGSPILSKNCNEPKDLSIQSSPMWWTKNSVFYKSNSTKSNTSNKESHISRIQVEKILKMMDGREECIYKLIIEYFKKGPRIVPTYQMFIEQS